MKITVFFLLIAFVQVSAKSYSQSTRLSLNYENLKLSDLFDKIEKISDYRFFYDSQSVDLSKSVSINSKDIELKSILENILGSDLSFEMVNSNIVVIKSNKAGFGVSNSQQQKSFTGRVTDSTGSPLPGVTVVVKGTTQGTITDAEGHYSFSSIPGDGTLVFSFIGMKSQEIAVAGKTQINVNMAEVTVGIEEVVAIGYGTQRKKDLTGAVSNLKMEEMENLPVTNVTEAMRGSIAGVNMSSDGRPGANGNLSIRGITSLSAGNSPLIVVDGIPLTGSLSDISPNDIETIDVLKDGSSAAVYGAKSSNGVILITTKRGKSGKPVIQYNGYYGVQDPVHLLKGLGPKEYIQKIIDYQKSVGVKNPDPTNYMTNLELQNYKDGKTIDPVKFTLQNSTVQSHNVSVSGKNERTSYYLSGSYIDEKGLVYNDNYKRIAFRTNVENKINDWLKVGLNSSFANRDDSGIEGDLGTALTLSPYSQMYFDDGVTLRRLVHGGSEAMAGNPIWSAERVINSSKSQNLIGNVYAEVDIPFIKGLSYRVNWGNTFNWYKNFTFTPPYFLEGFKDTGTGSKVHNESYNWILENIARYVRHFGKIHDIEATLLYSREHFDNNISTLSNSNFFTGVLGYNGLALGTNPVISTNAVESNSLSSMGRINYRLKDRYLVTLLARRDGYSAFGKGKKFGVFPSASVGWIISEENFMKDMKGINNLKIRYSYGETGNQAIAPYASLAKMGQNAYTFGDGSPTYIGLYTTAMGNDDLTWESTLSSNIGLDFEILDHRISGSVEYYSTKTKNLLLRRSIPVMTGFTSVITNLGGTSNEGLEVTLNSMNIRNKDVRWNSTLAFSTNKNKITSLYGLDKNGDGKEDDDVANSWFIGEPLGAIYDYTLDGIWQVGDNIPAPFKPGYFRIKDINNVPGVDTGDRSIIGKTTPDFRLSLGNTITYKNWSLYAFVNSSFGGMKSYPNLNPANFFADRLNLVDFGPYWTPENPSNTRPTIGYAMPFTHGFYRSLTFVRIQEVSLSYELPKQLLSKADIQSLKIYVSGKNLVTFTDWPGWDPEIEGIGYNAFVAPVGQSINGFPLPRTITLGINLTL